MATKKESMDNFSFDTEGKENHFCGLTNDQKTDISKEDSKDKLAYCVTDIPPWYLCIILGIQHFLTAFGGIVAIPLILSQGLCLQHDGLTQSHLISTILFVSGICTLLQVTLGVRMMLESVISFLGMFYILSSQIEGQSVLPILQGGTFTLLAPTTSLLSMPDWVCPAWTQNATLVNTSSPEFIQVWQSRIQVIQGSIMVGSLFQVLVGFSGIIGLFLRFIGPLTIAPTISLIGLSLFDSAGMNAGNHWGISAMTTCLIVLFSQYLCHIAIPLPAYSKAKRLHISKINIFQIIPVLLGITVSWLICYLLTIYNVLPSDPNQYGYLARTDIKGDVMGNAPWFRFPYPGQWGLPTVSLAGVLGILAGVISSMIESVGDYHACARLSGAPPPPKHAINRGIGIEGLGCLLAGAWGTGNGTTSYSENVGALGITKVGSRMVIVASGVIMIIMGLFGKIGAIFSTIPTPVIGGMFLVMFGVITAVGVSNLQYADMNSSRNIFIFGFSMFTGLVIPNWIIKNPAVLNTGVVELDHILQVLLTTGMFIGGFFGFVLDNTVPGTRHERGMTVWDKAHEDESENTLESEEVYGLPFGISSRLASYSWVRYIPFCPSYNARPQNDTSSNSLGKKKPCKNNPHVIVSAAL